MASSPFNRCNLPPWVIASRHFNENPQAIEIQGVRRANPNLFNRLATLDDPMARAALFHDYLDVSFQLHQWQRETSESGRKSLKNSYLRFLRGWMFDSNSVEGAVLKGWVESRMGLAPTFHHQLITGPDDPAMQRYLLDRMHGSARTSAIDAQLDLLYEYVQFELARRYPDNASLTLYRGINDFSEHQIIEQYDKHHFLLRLNNLNSFTNDFERAWEFGSRVLQTEVPLAKIFFCNDIFPSSLLKGEGELLVIGGEFEVQLLSGG
jgi:NAD+--dinitrogen-reductase ADP-D-ribosyltransferase